MTKASATLALILFLSPSVLGQAQAQTVQILTSFDNSRPTTECDVDAGLLDPALGEPRVRFCYVPLAGPVGDTPTNWARSHGGAFPGISVSGPAVVIARLQQSSFLNTPFAIETNPTPWVQTSAAYRVGIAIDATNEPCGVTGTAGADNVDAAISATVFAECDLIIPAGQTVTFRPVEASRRGAFAFDGQQNGQLTVLVFPQ